MKKKYYLSFFLHSLLFFWFCQSSILARPFALNRQSFGIGKSLLRSEMVEYSFLGGKPRKKFAKSSKMNGGGFFEMESRLFNVDLFIGGASNTASGDYLDYQKLYYQTNSTSFTSLGGQFSNFYYLTGGFQVRIAPMHYSKGFLSQVSGYLGFAFLKKGFSHEIGFANSAVPYVDRMQISESYNANFLSTQLVLRVGQRIYVEGGVSVDWFLNGLKTQKIVRTTDSTQVKPVSQAFLGGFSSEFNAKANLTSTTMAAASLGLVFGIGGQITPMFGLRFINTVNSTFFKETGTLKNFQSSIQATCTIN